MAFAPLCRDREARVDPYVYQGQCENCSINHELPRTPQAIREARRLMQKLSTDDRFLREGKMFGVLVGESRPGIEVTLASFSGMLDGKPCAKGFVGPTRSGTLTEREERATLGILTQLSQELSALDVQSARTELARKRESFDVRLCGLITQSKDNKAARERERHGPITPARLIELERISQHEGGRIRALRKQRRDALAPFEADLANRLGQRAQQRAQRRALSRSLQSAMHASHGLVNFAGRYAPLHHFFSDKEGIPTGTGECCAPKLLHEAALRGIRPRGMAEFWWGPSPSSGRRRHEGFYPACAEKCTPLLGHLLCGMDQPGPGLQVLYEDDDLIAIDKPQGLLSVPGRTSATADCAQTRLHLLHPREPFLRAVHRLDQASSGILLFARSLEIYRTLGSAFAQGRVSKKYRARITGTSSRSQGSIELPVRADVDHRPRQTVDRIGGKPATTLFRVLAQRGKTTDLELEPRTGRTHQLRLHCAHPEGLAAPIVGDALYGDAGSGDRLFLHAYRIEFLHPRTGKSIEICAPLPAEMCAP